MAGQAHDPARGWHDSGHFEGNTLILVETEERYRTVITHDSDGRYRVEGWCWELTVPRCIPDTDRHNPALLTDLARFTPRPGELPVTTQATDWADPTFPRNPRPSPARPGAGTAAPSPHPVNPQ